MVPTVRELFSAGIAQSTRRAYQSGTNRYLRFCSDYGVSPFPASEQNLCFFVGSLFRDGLTGSTVKSYLSGIRHSQIAVGLDDPHISSMPQLEYVVKGARKKSAGRSSRPRLPITPAILRRLRSVWSIDPNRFDATMLWAASCMCFCGFLRSGEAVVPSDIGFDPSVHLCHGDVLVDNTSHPQYLTVRLKASKTDPFRKGVTVYLGVTGTELCPVAAVLNFMVLRGNTVGPFFRFSNGRFLTRDRFVAQLRKALQAAGFDPKQFAGHSFRKGAATTAAACGMQDSLIKTLGRWESAAYSIYIETSRKTLCTASRTLAGRA